MRGPYTRQDYICIGDEDLISVVKVEPRTDYTLQLTFSTGERKAFDMRPLLGNSALAPLKNRALFMAARVACGTVVWNDDLDIAPEVLYANGVDVESAPKV